MCRVHPRCRLQRLRDTIRWWARFVPPLRRWAEEIDEIMLIGSVAFWEPEKYYGPEKDVCDV